MQTLAWCSLVCCLVCCSKDRGDRAPQKTPEPAIAWQAAAVKDVNGDGVEDFLVSAPGHVGVVDGASKSLRWKVARPGVADVNVSDGLVVVALAGKVEALKGADGTSVWVASIQAERVDGIDGGLTLATSKTGQVVLRSADGAIVTPADDRDHELVFASASVVVVRSDESGLRGFTVADAKLAWQAPIPGQSPRHLRGGEHDLVVSSRAPAPPYWYARISLQKGTLVEEKRESPTGNLIGFEPATGARYIFDGQALAMKGTMRKLDASLATVWTVDVAKARWPIQDLMMISGPQAYAIGNGSLTRLTFSRGSDGSRLVIFDGKTGQVVATRDLPLADKVVGSVGKRVLVQRGGATNALTALAAGTLKQSWSVPLAAGSARVFLRDDATFVAVHVAGAVAVTRLDAAGRTVWQTAVEGASIDAEPRGLGIDKAITGRDGVTLPSSPGVLRVLDLVTGTIREIIL